MPSPRTLSLLALALAAGLHASQPVDAKGAQALARLEARRVALGLDGDHGFHPLGVVKDADGHLHYRFQQTYRGVRIWGGDAILHVDAEGRELSLTDALQRRVAVDVTPAVARAEALALVDGVLAPKGLYANPPTAELVLVPRKQRIANPNPAKGVPNATDVTEVIVGHDLAWHVHTELENGREETAHTDFFVDAHTGVVLKRWSTLHTVDTPAKGTGNSQYSGTVTLDTTYNGTLYQLKDLTRGTGGVNPKSGLAANAAFDLAHATPSNGAPGSLFSDADDIWGDGANYNGGSTSSGNGQTAAVDAHYGLQMTWDMYLNVMGRNGIDDLGTATFNRLHYATAYDNAYWSDGCFCMTYGDGSGVPNGFNTLTELDVIGHELSHGVTANSVPGGLDYFDESGGLNESNSDIMGTMVEFYVKGAGGTGSAIPDTGGNWTIGEQLNPQPLRYMYKPSKDGQSFDAWDPYMYQADPHLSSGPNNHMFYFLSQGASATSSDDTYSSYLPAGMTGIGNDKAARIWYRNLTHYFVSTNNYAQARRGAIYAARDLYGALSPEYQAVRNAYAAINVGEAANPCVEDDVPPTVSNLQESGSSGNITFQVDAADDRSVSYVTFLVDGAPVATAANPGATQGCTPSGSSASFNVVLDSTTLPVGAHQLTAIATDTSGNASLASAPVAFSISNPTGQGILNGGFEYDFGGWTTTANAIVVPNYVRTGAKAGRLGGYGVANSDTISQTVTLPANASTLSLSFYLMVRTVETGTAAKDTMWARVRDSSGTTVLATLGTFTNLNAIKPTPAYAQHVYDLSAYKGQTVQISFEYTENGSNYTSFRIDDVTLSEAVPVVGVTTSATATVKRGMSQTFTASVSNAVDTSVTWSIQEGAAGGSITSGGVYTAPSAPGLFHVTATSVADPTKSSTITVQVINSTDLNNDAKVDGIDLGLLAFRLGQSGAGLAEDLNGDGTIDDLDIDLLLSDFGN
jgi:Zn-dependent metalloprotease